jgi:hypothetical protein
MLCAAHQRGDALHERVRGYERQRGRPEQLTERVELQEDSQAEGELRCQKGCGFGDAYNTGSKGAVAGPRYLGVEVPVPHVIDRAASPSQELHASQDGEHCCTFARSQESFVSQECLLGMRASKQRTGARHLQP